MGQKRSFSENIPKLAQLGKFDRKSTFRLQKLVPLKYTKLNVEND